MNPENVLELRLGGNYESLSARLLRPPPGTAQRLITAPVLATPGVAPVVAPPLPEITDLDPEPIPRVAPKPRIEPPRSRTEFHVVTLARGQTLYSLCKAELGSGGRWHEVARLNGWSEAQAGRLPAGQKVKLPVR